MFSQLLATAVLAISALFVVVDPVGLVPIFVAITEGKTRESRAAIARKACIIFVCVVGLFAIGGGLVFRLLGVSLAAFKIAGGGLLMLTALDMLRNRLAPERTSEEEMDEASHKQDVAVVPLAMPLLAGPGAIATAMVLTSRATMVWDVAIVVAAVIVIGIATFYILAAAHWVDRFLGVSGRSILERVMGLVLAAIAVQFVVDGLGEALPGLLSSREPAAVEDLLKASKAHLGLPAWLDGSAGS
ncbi:MarC family protein [Vulgatibacter incomptus]|uniref:UPF0056 membrane protein n=1 Tax=Vulgatibacter incomptus TaxID=1391653 RepID=A0A0K1PAP6_9BACT|nr:MarC family protein [Vulgatibacter incomptus]AKU90613.1 Membrane protein, MarC family [Vulgatibacter incomptus]